LMVVGWDLPAVDLDMFAKLKAGVWARLHQAKLSWLEAWVLVLGAQIGLERHKLARLKLGVFEVELGIGKKQAAIVLADQLKVGKHTLKREAVHALAIAGLIVLCI